MGATLQGKTLISVNDDDDDLVFYEPFNIIQVILRQRKSYNERP